MFGLLFREYYMLKIGMWTKIETDIETLEEAKLRKLIIRRRSVIENAEQPNPNFFQRLFPRNKEEKPGKDLYLYTVLSQLAILFFLFLFFNRMDGNKQSISESIQSNQFQGRMVVAILIVVMIILLERYSYLKHISRAIQDAAIKKGVSAENIKAAPLAIEEYETENDEDLNKNKPKLYERNISVRFNEADNLRSAFHDSKRNNRSQASITTKIIEDDDAEELNDKKEKERNILLIIKLILHATLILVVHFVIF